MLGTEWTKCSTLERCHTATSVAVHEEWSQSWNPRADGMRWGKKVERRKEGGWESRDGVWAHFWAKGIGKATFLPALPKLWATPHLSVHHTIWTCASAPFVREGKQSQSTFWGLGSAAQMADLGGHLTQTLSTSIVRHWWGWGRETMGHSLPNPDQQNKSKLSWVG